MEVSSEQTQNTRKRILILSTAYYPFVGGAEIAIKEIAERQSSNFDFDLLTARMDRSIPKVEKVGNVVVHRIGVGVPILDKFLLPFAGALKIKKLNKNNRYLCFWNVLISWSSWAGYIYNFFRCLVFKKSVPIVLTLQEGDSEEHLRFKWMGLISLSWRVALKKSKYLTVLSSFLLKRAHDYGWDGPYSVIPNGVDVGVFDADIFESEKKEMELMFGKKNGDIYLVTSSRLVKKNAVDDIIKALTYLPDNISLVVIGKGEEGRALQVLSEQFKVSHRVKFLGFIPQSDIPKYFSICDIFVRPSRSEGFGNSFIEAMTAKLPVIATPVGGIVDFLSDKETGFFCSPDNPKSLAEQVNFILENPDLKNEVVERAYNMAVSRFSWDSIASRMKNEVWDKIK